MPAMLARRGAPRLAPDQASGKRAPIRGGSPEAGARSLPAAKPGRAAPAAGGTTSPGHP